MTERPEAPSMRGARVLIVGLTAVVVVLALALVIMTIGRFATPVAFDEPADVNVLATSDDECVTCHFQQTPGIVEQYGHSTMAAAGVTCQNCHVVDEGYPGSVPHEGVFVLSEPTTAMCQNCHVQEVAQFNQSRHGLPAYVAYAGDAGLTTLQAQMYASIPEGGSDPEASRARNALHQLEGEAITRFACESCHDIGKPADDGSVGQCSSCHLRHEFSLEQARKPETCNYCHIGPDHPQWEIYQESPHGIAYATGGDSWHWEAEPGTLTAADFPAPTCATCHMSGFGSAGTTHDIGDRLTWFLYAPVSSRRPAWQDNKVRMQGVCRECHNQNFITEFYAAADAATEQVNAWVEESNELIAPLREHGLLTAAPFDEPIDFTHFNLWHHWGRTAKFGVWMQGPDYVQWHGAYEILHDMAELRVQVREKLDEAGLGPAPSE
ncbi:MAG: multiheme c-type cytochrome [Caldilineaceae bacterium]|nr:multiheme c-type cytochrome [Caldilineaceae bacterium]